jgi:hypothetical protein
MTLGNGMKFTTDRPFADPEKAARRLMQHARAFEPIQDSRIYIEVLNGAFLFGDRGTPAEYAAGLDRAVALGWLHLHESGTYVKFTQAGADLFTWDDPVCHGWHDHDCLPWEEGGGGNLSADALGWNDVIGRGRFCSNSKANCRRAFCSASMLIQPCGA